LEAYEYTTQMNLHNGQLFKLFTMYNPQYFDMLKTWM